MRVLSRFSGLLLVVAVFLDALATTLVVGEGAGPGTRWLTGRLWGIVLRLCRKGEGSAVLGSAGAVILILTFTV